MNAHYQCEYVWLPQNMQALLYSVFHQLPIDSISVVLDPSAEKYCEVVDGKQRLTTLLNFYENKFPVYVSSKNNSVLPPELLEKEEHYELFFDDLSLISQREFKKIHLPQIELFSANNQPISMHDKLAYFYRVNFAGIPISQEHKQRVENMIQTNANNLL